MQVFAMLRRQIFSMRRKMILPETLTPEIARLVLVCGLGLLCLASLLGGLLRTIFLVIFGVRLLRIMALPLLASSVLPFF